MKRVLLFFVSILVSVHVVYSQQDLRVRSDCKELEGAFAWAKEKALSFVVTGQRGPVDIYKEDQISDTVDYIPSYWAGYPLRTAFYSRDFCHQVIGAHLLGLEVENFTMMRAFAQSADASKRWFPLWAINFDGSTYKLDYRSSNNFVREIPAVFELVEKNLELYRWTSDHRYLNDPHIWEFCSKAVSEFITLHDGDFKNGVAESTGTGDIFVGTATYNEYRDQTLIEAGDGISSQYKALESFGILAQQRGDLELSRTYSKRASALKTYFNTDWGVRGNKELYNRGYDLAKNPVAGWGNENSWFLPMKEITDVESVRHLNYLDYIDEQLSSATGLPKNIEAITYIPEIFFKYSQNERGWKWLKHIMANIDQRHITGALTGTNGNYPEVSFVLIRNIVHDMAGISPGDHPSVIQTCSHLPSEISNIEIDDVKVGDAIFSIRHEGTENSTFQMNSDGPAKIWRATFLGNHSYLTVNGKKFKSKKKILRGYAISYIDIKVEDDKPVAVSCI
ncbi:hypothetical protein [Sphingobacterium yanglingense]|uniref:Uncharacterized protein n=1 Tax=Sphingobacterium yanglingense TaxID=1437280 RepID=A0A4R6WIZ6_9SPHI|nr:hypothetical protein [Sphingobacterium yanglingense]TDQ77934.1 hypothetical protein CLV99_1905 [Sphingobacterium yanglingense]